MARTLLDLAKSLEKRAVKIEEAVSKLAAETAILIVSDLVFVTPVDTSQALSNWQVSLNTPVSSPIGPYSPGFFGSTQGASAHATIRAAKAVLARKRPGDVIYISNVLDYIVDLNNGTSRQRPAGFVERSSIIGRKYAEQAKVKV